MAADWSWHALTVAPTYEFRARAYLLDPATLEAQGLTDEDVHVLVPVRHVLQYHTPRGLTDRRKRRSLEARPRIPGYLLMGVQPYARPVWRHILALPHVLGVLSCQGVPVPIGDPELVVAMLTDLLGVSRRRRPGKAGIEIASGPYAGRMATIVEVAGGDPEIRMA